MAYTIIRLDGGHPLSRVRLYKSGTQIAKLRTGERVGIEEEAGGARITARWGWFRSTTFEPTASSTYLLAIDFKCLLKNPAQLLRFRPLHSSEIPSSEDLSRFRRNYTRIHILRNFFTAIFIAITVFSLIQLMTSFSCVWCLIGLSGALAVFRINSEIRRLVKLPSIAGK